MYVVNVAASFMVSSVTQTGASLPGSLVAASICPTREQRRPPHWRAHRRASRRGEQVSICEAAVAYDELADPPAPGRGRSGHARRGCETPVFVARVHGGGQVGEQRVAERPACRFRRALLGVHADEMRRIPVRDECSREDCGVQAQEREAGSVSTDATRRGLYSRTSVRNRSPNAMCLSVRVRNFHDVFMPLSRTVMQWR